MMIELKPKFCPKCGTKVEGDSISCSFCGKTFRPATVTAEPTSIESPGAISQTENASLTEEVSSPRKESRILISIGIGLALIFAIGISLSGNYSAVEQESRSAAERQAILDAEQEERDRAIADTSWLPTDFIKFDSNPNVAYLMDDRDCPSGGGVCFPMTIVTNKYCSSLYIAANVEKAGSTLDSASATVSEVSAGQQVQMMLQWKVYEGDEVDFTVVNCN
jgi:hypothetical protein